MESFTQLQAWKSGIALLQEVYILSRKFPKSELYELTKQIRRASMSVIANIAEGFSKRSPADKANKYTIASSECSEVTAFLYAAIAVECVTENDAKSALLLATQTGKLLSGLIQSQMAKQLPKYRPYAPHPTPQP